MADSIEVPLGIEDFHVLGSELVDGRLEVSVVSTFPHACWHCGSTGVRGHGSCTRRVRDTGLGRAVLLLWRQRRFRCDDCGRTSRERHPAIPERQGITHRFHRHLFKRACSQPFIDVAREERVSHWRVVEAFDAHTSAPPALPALRMIALDESSFRKRFNYMTVLFDPVGRSALEAINGRTQDSTEALLLSLPTQVRAGIETVVIDCCWPFRKAIEAVLPDARIVTDRFHVCRSVDSAAATVRKRYGRRSYWRGRDGGVARQHNPRNDREVTKLRWVFAGRRHHLDAEQLAQLEAMFVRFPEIGVAWWMKEAFAAVYEAPTREEGERRLGVWVHNLEAAGLVELKNAWRSLANWREQILAYFDDRQTNAFAEGSTNKIKVMNGAPMASATATATVGRSSQPAAAGPDPPSIAKNPTKPQLVVNSTAAAWEGGLVRRL